MRHRIPLLLLFGLLAIPQVTFGQMQGITVEVLQRTSVSDQPDKEAITIVATFEPGATTGWHTHPGDEYALILEGALELRSLESDTRVLDHGAAYHNGRGWVHETVNTSDRPARITATFVIDRGQPISIPWSQPE
jgi:quercetin dioxygenase-like cupin family protein